MHAFRPAGLAWAAALAAAACLVVHGIWGGLEHAQVLHGAVLPQYRQNGVLRDLPRDLGQEQLEGGTGRGGGEGGQSERRTSGERNECEGVAPEARRKGLAGRDPSLGIGRQARAERQHNVLGRGCGRRGGVAGGQ